MDGSTQPGKRRCDTCEFAVPLKQARTPTLNCVRYPPQILMVMVPAQPTMDPATGRLVQSQPQVAYQPQFPQMTPDAWCGEWKLREPALHLVA
jgi:hypothetical protein